MTTINLTQQEIADLRTRRNGIKQKYGARNQLFERYEEIYFMRDKSKPKDAGVDPNDWKVTTSPVGRNKVTGLKRMLDTAEIHIKVKDQEGEKGKHANSDKIEAGLKAMLKISGEYKPARVERDTNLSSILYGPVILTCNSVDDLIETKKGYKTPADKYVVNQLKNIRRRTPFLIDVINAKESYPEQGKYGLVGHLQEYLMKGSEIREEWGCNPTDFNPAQDYTVQDFFLYDQRLTEANGKTLFAGQWLAIDDGTGEYSGVTSIPIFVRYAGGSTLFSKPEEQLQSFLYAYAQGEWDKRDSLYLTYLFTAIFTQGIPGPVIVRDPDDTSEIKVDYTGGVKVITAKGKLENIQVIDGDVLQLKNLMDRYSGESTIQDQTIGGPGDAATFSSYVMQVNSGKLPAIDPTEAQEQCYKDLFLHILQRIKAEGIANELIDPADIPDDIDLEVTLEPDLAQDDLRNANIFQQLKNAGANVSDEWLNTNLLKIADSEQMFRQTAKEQARKTIWAAILQDPEIIKPMIMAAMGMSQQPPQQPPQMQPGMEQGQPPMGVMPEPGPEATGEGMPMTDAMPTPEERPNGGQRLRSA